MEQSLDEDDDDAVFAISEDLIGARDIRQIGISTVDFDGLLLPALQVQEDARGGCGGHTWPAGMVLAKHLLREPQLTSLCDKTIIELGAGGGLVGLALALALRRINDTGSNFHVNITDQEVMLPLMKQNIALNGLAEKQIAASVLDWGTDTAHFSQPNILLAADCVYFEPAFPLLLKTLQSLIGPETICYFCFKKRRKADLRFVKDLKKAFKVVDILDDPDREIWSKEALFLYMVTAKT